jgi:hypothetical protein
MGNGSNGLIVSQARDRAVIDDLEDASLGPGCSVGSLVENALSKRKYRMLFSPNRRSI